MPGEATERSTKVKTLQGSIFFTYSAGAHGEERPPESLLLASDMFASEDEEDAVDEYLDHRRWGLLGGDSDGDKLLCPDGDLRLFRVYGSWRCRQAEDDRALRLSRSSSRGLSSSRGRRRRSGSRSLSLVSFLVFLAVAVLSFLFFLVFSFSCWWAGSK